MVIAPGWVVVPVTAVRAGDEVAIRGRSWTVKRVVRPSEGLVMLMGGPFGFQAVASELGVYVRRETEEIGS